MSKQKEIVYTENDRAIVSALKGGDMTLAQLREATGLDLKPGHITSAMKKGLICSSGEVEVQRPTSREVSTYNFVSAEAFSNGDKPFNYTDGEKEILAAAAGIDSPFTLADLAKAMGREKVYSGSINGLVKKGNISKGEPVEVPAISKSTVKVYSFVKDIA